MTNIEKQTDLTSDQVGPKLEDGQNPTSDPLGPKWNTASFTDDDWSYFVLEITKQAKKCSCIMKICGTHNRLFQEEFKKLEEMKAFVHENYEIRKH